MPGAPWRISERNTLIQSVREAKAPSEIALPGRTPAAIHRMAARLHLVGDGIPRRRWTDEQRGQLRSLVQQGRTAGEISATGLLPYNRNAIQKQMQRLGLADPELSRTQRMAMRLAGPALEAFQLFLRERAERMTPEQIALEWNQTHLPGVSHRRVVYHLDMLGVKPTRAQVLQMPYSRAKRQKLLEQFVDDQKRRCARRRSQRSRELEKQAADEVGSIGRDGQMLFEVRRQQAGIVRRRTMHIQPDPDHNARFGRPL